jgi:hypothetical protein
MLTCSFGVAPSTLSAVPRGTPVNAPGPMATVMDHVPLVNIPPFGMCNTLSNPAVSAATAARGGVFTPAACLPVIPAPWTPGSAITKVGPFQALTDNSKCMCQWGGMISITPVPSKISAK